MINIEIISTIVGILAGVGALAAGLGFGYSQMKIGSVKAKDELIATLKETATVEREKAARLAEEKITLVNSHQVQINELNNKMGKLQGLYEAAEANKKEYLAILQGRDPAQQQFMELMTKAAQQSNQITEASKKYMTDTLVILSEIRKYMETQNKKVKKERNA